MLFAGIPSFGQQIMILMIFFGVVFHFGKKFLNANPDVKDVAKKAVATKAIEIIMRLIKK